MLRLLGRRSAGQTPLSDEEARWLDKWLAALDVAGLVVCYDDKTPDGFYRVPRQPDEAA